MTLRRHLSLTVVLTTVPLLATAGWLFHEFQDRAAEQGLRESIVGRMEAGGRERCEADPGSFFLRGPGPPGPGPDPMGHGPGSHQRMRRHAMGGPPPLEVFPYDADLRPASPGNPPFPEALARALRAGRDSASAAYDTDGGRGLQMALRMTWDEGPCAVLLVRRQEPPVPPPVSGGLAWGALALGGGLLLAVALAAGPIVRRIRRLTAEVRRSAASRWEVPVRAEGNDEISELARAFNDAGAELRAHLASLEERERTLRAFVANTTHDVMLPLTVLQGHLTSLARRAETGGEMDGLVRASIEEAHYLACLVHNLGAAAKLEAGEPHVQRHPLDLGRLVERAVGRHRTLARQREVALDFAVPEPSPWVEGDVTLLEQAASNVIHNAVRYNRGGGHVAVLLEARGGRFSLRVIDDGPGVPEPEIPRLGERNFRGDEARTRQPGGSGLGLSIARGVAARHGLTLRIRRSEHGGLEVEFEGPTCPAPDAAEGRP